MIPLVTASAPYSAPFTAVKATALRRQIPAELLEIQGHLELHQSNQLKLKQPIDELTQSVSEWHTSFKKAFSLSRDPEAILKVYLTKLQELLRDPLTDSPLDEKSVLGNDGETYGYQSLRLYLFTVPAAERHQFPLDPGNPKRFVTTPHPIVPKLLEWLERHGSQLRDPEIESEYAKHLSVLPELPTPITEKIARIKAKTAAIEAKRMAHVVRPLEEMKADVNKEIDKLSTDLKKIGEETNKKLKESIEKLLKRDFAGIASLKADIEQLEKGIDKLEKENSAIKKALEENREAFSQLEIDEMRLKLLIQEAALANDRRKKGKKKALLTTIAVVALCVTGTLALSGALSSAGAGVGGAVLPSKGGAMMGFIF